MEEIRRRAIFVSSLIIFSCVVPWIYYKDIQSTITDKSIHRQHTNQKEKSNGRLQQKGKEAYRILDDIHNKRVRHIRSVCKTMESLRPSGSVILKLLYSTKHHLACRMVAKVGTTFMIQMFGILNNRATPSIFTASRTALHNSRRSHYQRFFEEGDLVNYTTMIVARNPYSRLYSAYIDKVFLPNNLRLSDRIINSRLHFKQDIKCTFEITFEDFLLFVIKNPLGDIHYKPQIEKYPNFCVLKNFVVVKQESFVNDVEYALEKANIDEKNRELIHSILTTQNAETTAISLTKSLYSYVHKLEKRLFRNTTEGCFSWKDVAQRLWKSFQIQGYIHVDSPFPSHKFEEEHYKNVNTMINVLQEEIGLRPLSSTEKIQQRRNALLEAYSTISEDIIQKLQEIYAKDFLVYGYDNIL